MRTCSSHALAGVVAVLLLTLCVDGATQRTLFNVTISLQPDGPPSYYVAAVPNIAAVANIAVQGIYNPTTGQLTVVSNSSGDVMWSTVIASSGFGIGLGSLLGCNAFAYYGSDGVLTIADAATGTAKWRNDFGSTTLPQAFTVHEASDQLAWVDAQGHVVVVDGASCATAWSTTIADVPKWAEYTGTLALTMSEHYIVPIFSGVLYTLPVVAPHVPLYSSNISMSFQSISSRHAIAHDTLVFCSQSTVSTLDLRNGKFQCIAALNTTQYSYSEVIIAPEGSTIYLVIIDESFASRNCGRRCRRLQEARGRGGNNYPMFVTANDIHTGATLWSWFTDDTVSDLAITASVVAAVSSGGPFALSRTDGGMVSSFDRGLDYEEVAPPLIYGNSIWYFATEYMTMDSAIINFVAVQDDGLVIS